MPRRKKKQLTIEFIHEIFKDYLDKGWLNEQKVTKSIDKIIDTAQNENDHRTSIFLEWFVHEQIEEEDLFESILQKFDVIGRDKLALHEIDKILDKLSQKSS